MFLIQRFMDCQARVPALLGGQNWYSVPFLALRELSGQGALFNCLYLGFCP